MAEYDPRNQLASELSKGWGATDNTTWGHDLRSYEFSKRHEIHPGKMVQPELTVLKGIVSNEERKFNPITQRFTDPAIEKALRKTEKEITIEHCNRAKDIQNLREQPHDVIHNGSRTQGLEPLASPPKKHLPNNTNKDPYGKMIYPDSFQGRTDYNILSNHGYDVHHYAPEEERPLPPLRIPRAREVPAGLQRDFNIVSNRYKEDHDVKTARDQELALAECTAKHHTRNRFHPLAQKFEVREEESRMQVADAIHTKEEMLLKKSKQPPTMKHRATAYYNPINHAFKDEQMLKWMDLVEDERKLRYRTKHFVELDIHNRDLAADHQTLLRKCNRQHWDRQATEINRGHNILTNVHFEGRNACQAYKPYAEPEPSPWANALMRNGKDMSVEPEATMGTEVMRRTINPNFTPRTEKHPDRTRPGPMERLNLATPRMPNRVCGSGTLDRTRTPPRVMSFEGTAPPAPSLPASSMGSAVYSQGI